MKIVFIVLLLTPFLRADSARNLDSLSAYLESHDLAVAGSTKHCFSSFLPQLELVGDTWSTEYNGCMQQATTGRGRVLTKVGSMQKFMRQAALSIDGYIESCLNTTDVLDFFNCFAKLSKQQLTTMYAISFNASENALSLTQQLNGIDVQRYLCTNRTEQSYVLDTARIFDALDNCLLQAGDTSKATV